MASDNQAPVSVMAAVFSDVSQAETVLKQVQQMDKDGTIDVIDAVVASRAVDGKISIKETAELTPKKGLKRGAVIGGVIGLIFPPSLLGSAILGGGIGAIVGKFSDRGFDNDVLKEWAEGLEPGTSAVVAVVEQRWVTSLENAIDGYDKLFDHAIDADFAAELTVADE